MAAINFPDAPTNGQIFESGGMSWTYVAGIGWTLNSAIVEAGSGFTFIADTMPLPVNVGDTWFDSSTGASGGTSWVAVEEGPAGASEKVWVQFAPGAALAAAFDPLPKGRIGAVSSSNVSVTVTTPIFLNDLSIVLTAGRNYAINIQSAGAYTTGGTPGSVFYVCPYVDSVAQNAMMVVDTVLSGGYLIQTNYSSKFRATATKNTYIHLAAWRGSAASGTLQARYSWDITDEGMAI